MKKTVEYKLVFAATLLQHSGQAATLFRVEDKRKQAATAALKTLA